MQYRKSGGHGLAAMCCSAVGIVIFLISVGAFVDPMCAFDPFIPESVKAKGRQIELVFSLLRAFNEKGFKRRIM